MKLRVILLVVVLSAAGWFLLFWYGTLIWLIFYMRFTAGYETPAFVVAVRELGKVRAVFSLFISPALSAFLFLGAISLVRKAHQKIFLLFASALVGIFFSFVLDELHP